MKANNKRRYRKGVLTALLIVITCASPMRAQTIRTKIMTRIFWQDRDTDQLSYADITAADKWSIKRGWVDGFPKLDAEQQDLVQMKASDGVLMVGVRDHDDGKHQSGWVAIDTGVFEEPHGNHTHWKYTRKPSVKQKQLDTDQGNPAHLYVYDRQFYLANDRNNGFTKALPTAFMQTGRADVAKFYPGGGNHITLAAVNNTVAYSSWIDGGGPNAGRVDVVDLRQSQPKISYSFNLPTGVIHGATASSGKVFLAPADGVCWVAADTSLRQSADSVKVHHLSLGKDEESDKPMRTGAFENSRNWVLFSTGKADQSGLCLVNAALTEPKIVKVPIDVADGLKLTTPRAVLSLGNRYAFLFQDRTDSDSDVQEKLTIVELDPNRDRDYSDARVKISLPVGASKINGHYGHHAITFDAYGRYAIFTEPADGIINVMALQNMKIIARFRVGGAPTASSLWVLRNTFTN
ncbi:hypothetical protein [Fuerstiella marisgermanici]|uniref:WD40-like Beta Propeller Repeat n=1 Tax=Fuerstiella marisgermanici TaxID=1891926 RepID=A0A1P8WLD5_9PLAN|nr:hypothetical protein [Fuerstiella marisgermanici]APZ94867.1 hypothetical protein Fuma_04517 [Fuerstiella marisgermanici]